MRRQSDLLGKLLLLCLPLLLLLCAAVGTVFAQGEGDRPAKIVVAVLEVKGAPRVQAVLTAALRKQYTVVPLVKWNAAARRLAATGRAPDEIAMVAGDIKVGVVITGSVKKDKETEIWTLTISPRHGPTGKTLEKLKYPLRSPRVDAATLKQLLAEIGPAVEKASKGPQPEPVVEEPKEPVAEVKRPGNEEENPLEKLRQQEEAERRRKEKERPKWYPWVDGGVGFVLGGRSFSFTEDPGSSTVKCYDFTGPAVDPTDVTGQRIIYKYTPALRKCPSFAPSVAPGLRIDVTGYPLAFMRFNALRGLGVGLTFDYLGWPSSRVCNKTADDGSCAVFGAELQTSEYRVEVGLRWHWNILNKRSRPSLLASLQYGLHQFAIQKEARTYAFTDKTGAQQMTTGVDDHGLPDLRYQYIDLSIGGRVPYYATEKWYIGLVLNFHYHILLDYGEIETQFLDSSSLASLFNGGGYGPVSGGYGLRVDLTAAEWMPWRGLTVRLSGYYELFAMNFQLLDPNSGIPIPPQNRTPDTAARHLAQGAQDQYFGGILQVGYQY